MKKYDNMILNQVSGLWIKASSLDIDRKTVYVCSMVEFPFSYPHDTDDTKPIMYQGFVDTDSLDLAKYNYSLGLTGSRFKINQIYNLCCSGHNLYTKYNHKVKKFELFATSETEALLIKMKGLIPIYEVHRS